MFTLRFDDSRMAASYRYGDDSVASNTRTKTIAQLRDSLVANSTLTSAAATVSI